MGEGRLFGGLSTKNVGYRKDWIQREYGRGRNVDALARYRIWKRTGPGHESKKMKNGKCTKNLGRSAEWVYQLEDCRCRVKKLCQSGRLSAQGKQAATDWESVGTEQSLLRQTGSLSTRNKLVLAVLNWKIAGTGKRSVQGKSSGS